MAGVTGAVAEAARHVGKRAFSVREQRERQRHDHSRQRQYNPHQRSIAMRRARPRRRRTITLGCAGAALVALAAFMAAPDAVEVTFKEWQTPSTPPYPHDPEVAPDGSVWYTAQRASALGRLDPATGDFQGVSASDTQLRTARPGRRCRGSHLVHGQRRGSHRQRWTRRPAESPSTRCRMRAPGIRTRRSSTRAAFSGSRSRAATSWAVWIPRRGRSRSSSRRRRTRARTGSRSIPGRAVLRRIQHEQDRQHRSEDDDDHRVSAAECRLAPAADRDCCG